MATLLSSHHQKANTIPKKWWRAKLIAIPKPGKDQKLPASYHRISLLSKILENLILQHISTEVKSKKNVDQAGSHKGHSGGKEVLAQNLHGNWPGEQAQNMDRVL